MFRRMKYLLLIVLMILSFTSCTNNEITQSNSTSNSVKTNNVVAEKRIKGNINKKGEKIYHMPGGASYNRTDAEEYFSTEEEAKAAGFRRAKR